MPEMWNLLFIKPKTLKYSSISSETNPSSHALITTLSPPNGNFLLIPGSEDGKST